MKNRQLKFSSTLGLLLVLVACSTTDDSFLSRNSHALSTRYNILYNGQIGLDKGIAGIKSQNVDDFWKRLPIERMQMGEQLITTEKIKNPDFELAETKATKAIQKHSMNIKGRERNYQVDEAYLLLGKARYYDKRFLPALDAFNYILYKYPTSSTIYEAKIWREKTNMRLGNDGLVIKNITKMLKEKKLKKQVIADANALLSEAFLNNEEKDSAVTQLKIAVKFTRNNNERARYRFILGQLYEELGKKDSAIYSYEAVIKMNRKSERKYVIHSHIRKAQLFDYKKGDTLLFVNTYKKLLADRENRLFLDVLNHQKGIFYDNLNNRKQALHFYNQSLKKATTDQYVVASNYRNIGNMYFKDTDYLIAAKYYDSTLVKLDSKTREYARISKIRKDLDDVIIYESIAKTNDSILKVVAMSPSDRNSYYERYIAKLKIADEIKRNKIEKEKEKVENMANNSSVGLINSAIPNPNSGIPSGGKVPFGPPSIPSATTASTSTFYFYTASTVAFGKLEFKKIWGVRNPKGNWRLSETNANSVATDDTNIDPTKENKTIAFDPENVAEYTTEFYTKQLPTAVTVIDSLAKERNDAYYQLGVIYKEKFKEYNLAASKLEQVLDNKPEEKLVLPTLYNLYKIYQITNSAKALAVKDRINAQFANSRYAQIINNGTTDGAATNDSPEGSYNQLYKSFTEGQYLLVLEQANGLITQFGGDAILPKLELLKANTIGKISGLAAYKTALQYVADNYPNKEEGKKAEEVLSSQIPYLEKIEFDPADTNSWKVLYKVTARTDDSTKKVEESIKKFMTNSSNKSISYSYDFYTGTTNFLVIHGLTSKELGQLLITDLKENKDYKIANEAITITNQNYKVIQIKKNLEAYQAIK
ncbi:type IX secretion system periplasmic lipoprotein PorW/SprE [Flavobacterium muglaense]|uniref:Gliding motility protein n=1 Tax=Flavobacterium muglaense TaxID=2764716 RepID=A0A923N080_9FLAO|nr:tetratricopeptide repeat protein [Flavobacterium muglaense]MBC5838473.1 gliding motility protein [Flavobacterium muglaense]MBC5844966.1 gliding motility protein [Flavobacterium muglaense]